MSLASEIFGVFRAMIYNTNWKKEVELERKRGKDGKEEDQEKEGRAEKLFDDVGKSG